MAGVLLLAGAIVLAWSNSLSGPFVLDDHSSIVDNATIRHLWPPDWLSPPATAGETVSGRPGLNFTFALNHALGGLDVRGYHVVNLLIHVAAALTLWGLLRRTPAVGGAGIALAAALLWAVHPLQTAAVTYLVQRAESLAALFVLLALYGFVRGAVGGGRRWFGFALVACVLGIVTKETAAVAPVLVLLYDRAFLAGGFRAAWRLRGRVHAALFASWLPLAVLIWSNHQRGGSVGNGIIGPGSYFLTQGEAIVRYLGLGFWPVGQVFDYGSPVVTGFGAVAPQFLLLATLAGAALWLFVRNRPAGFAGAAFFGLLAPSSSVVPVATQTMAEHRFYLALAPVMVLLCATLGPRLPRRLAAGLAAVVVMALGATTFARNQVYRSPLALWSETVARRPDNPRAHYNLGRELASVGRADEAAMEFHRTLTLQPNHAFAHFELGKAALLSGRWPEAATRFGAAVQADPRFVDARVDLALALVRLGRSGEAIEHYRLALAAEPAAADIRAALAAAHLALGQSQVAQGDVAGAEASLRESLRLDEGPAAGWFALGNLLARQQRFTDAIAAYRDALTRNPALLDARSNLANCLLFTRRVDEAIVQYEAVLQARPDDLRTRENLRIAREAQAGRE